jgi:hypothetical protein
MGPLSPSRARRAHLCRSRRHLLQSLARPARAPHRSCARPTPPPDPPHRLWCSPPDLASLAAPPPDPALGSTDSGGGSADPASESASWEVPAARARAPSGAPCPHARAGPGSRCRPLQLPRDTRAAGRCRRLRSPEDLARARRGERGRVQRGREITSVVGRVRE